MVEVCGYEIEPGQIILYKTKIPSGALKEAYVEGFTEDHGIEKVEVRWLYPDFLPNVTSQIDLDDILTIVKIETEGVPLEEITNVRNRLILHGLIVKYAAKD